MSREKFLCDLVERQMREGLQILEKRKASKEDQWEYFAHLSARALGSLLGNLAKEPAPATNRLLGWVQGVNHILREDGIQINLTISQLDIDKRS